MKMKQVSAPHEIAIARSLFQEYADWLGVDLCFQGFAAELARLPGQYAPPRGRLLLATENGEAAGCVALRPLDASACEMKRLYVRPVFRGAGAGKKLAARIVEEAREIGYAVMRLDTLPSMQSAIRLYESLGFVRRSAYYDTPLKSTIFMELRLNSPENSHTVDHSEIANIKSNVKLDRSLAKGVKDAKKRKGSFV